MNTKKLVEFFINQDETTLQAMKKLDANTHRILFVIDEDNRLVGSLTDGDIRRWILSGKDLKEKVVKVCHNSPITISDSHHHDEAKEIMLSENIECIPIVDKNNIIIDMLFWTDLFRTEKKSIVSKKLDLPVVIMAGGFGKRLEPFTTVLPKPLIPINGKPIIEHIIDKFRKFGVEDFYMTLNHKSKIVKAYFEEIDKEYNLTYAIEKKPLGTVGSLKLLKKYLPDDFVVTNCDIIIYADYSEIIDFHREHKYDLTLVSSMMHYKIPYGICKIDTGGKLIEIQEKPEYNFLISTGMYILNKEILDLIPDNKLYHITQLIDEIKNKNGSIGVFPISEKSWADTGEWEKYNATVKRYFNNDIL